ncbi:16217_t:CDS:2, partial [Funneliformis mosseae]
MGPVGNTQSRDIYEVQPRRNKSLKLLALHILKHLPEDILREELDILSFKSIKAIPDYEPCMECDIPILTEDPPRSLVLNVCADDLGIIFNPPVPDLVSKANQSSEISPSMGTFALSLPPIQMLGIESFLRIAPQPQGSSKPLVYLTCKHIIYYNYIDNPRKLCPICLSTNNTETDDMETDDDET